MDAFSKDEDDVSSNSNMDMAIDIGIVAMQIIMAKNMAEEFMVDVGDIGSEGWQ